MFLFKFKKKAQLKIVLTHVSIKKINTYNNICKKYSVGTYEIVVEIGDIPRTQP